LYQSCTKTFGFKVFREFDKLTEIIFSRRSAGDEGRGEGKNNDYADSADEDDEIDKELDQDILK
jgi:hypothetical protein